MAWWWWSTILLVLMMVKLVWIVIHEAKNDQLIGVAFIVISSIMAIIILFLVVVRSYVKYVSIVCVCVCVCVLSHYTYAILFSCRMGCPCSCGLVSLRVGVLVIAAIEIVSVFSSLSTFLHIL